jgi:hypothetical protein
MSTNNLFCFSILFFLISNKFIEKEKVGPKYMGDVEEVLLRDHYLNFK